MDEKVGVGKGKKGGLVGIVGLMIEGIVGNLVSGLVIVEIVLLVFLMLKSLGKVPYEVLKCALVTECKSVKSEE